jgi:hypothetical protein
LDAARVAAVEEELTWFDGRFAPLFGRTEARARSAPYLRGLLGQQTDRGNAETLAAAGAGATPRTRQRLLTEAPWGDDRMAGGPRRAPERA